MEPRLIAVQLGDALKYVSSVNEIDRIGTAVLKVVRDDFPNKSITSVRAQRVHDWVLSLARADLTTDERGKPSRQVLPRAGRGGELACGVEGP